MRHLPRLAALPLLAFIGVASSAHDLTAQSGGRGSRESDRASVEIVFSTDEATQIRAYFGANPQAGTESLPPGIRKNLARGKPLPPGIAKKVLPRQLEQALPTHEGFQRLQVGLDVFLVEVATGIIHDVLMDVIR